jgi:predicted nucleic acid-binding protein
MAFVLDASVTLGWCFRDEENAFAHRVLRRLRDDSAWAGPVLDLARAQGLSVYDAAYLHLAMREGLPLATLDDDLRAAASRVGVSLIA